MSSQGISNCGDYLPGYEPRPITTTSNTTPPTYIPQGNTETQIFQTPYCPPSPTTGSPGVPGPGTPGGPANPNTPNTGSPAGPTTGGPIGPTTGGPAGPSSGGTGPTTGGPAGPSTGEPASTGGPITGGGSTKYKCVTTTIYCQNDSNIQPPSARRVQAILKNCTVCNPIDTFGEPDPTCIYNSQAECIASPCGPNQITESNCIGPITQGGSTTTNEGGSTTGSNSNSTTTQGTGGSTTSIGENREELLIVVNNQVSENFTSSGTVTTTTTTETPPPTQRAECPSLYAEYYNFFNVPVTQEIVFVSNERYTNIFSNQVAKEIYYFIDREGTGRAWDEKNVSNLTNDKIAASLRPELRQALNNISNVGNTKISANTFYSAIKSHILRGTLSELDPSVYITIAEKQKLDPIYTYSQTGQSIHANINLAFAIFERLGINPNYNIPFNGIALNDDYKRMRFLPEDLETYVSVLQDDGLLYKLYTTNYGIPTYQIPGPEDVLNPASGTILPFGAGAGYYFSSMFLNGQEYPLMTFNNLSSAYYLSPRDRDNALRILGADPALTLTVSSLINSHEFTSTYNPSADLVPTYFKLDLDSVTDIITPNSVVTPVSASYIKITNEEAVAHSRDNGFNVVTVNLDYRDPMMKYAIDSGLIHYRSNEFNLKSFGRNTTLVSNKTMLRTIPQALVLSPGNGTYHNPFDGRSTYQDYTNSTVIRSLKIEPSIYMSNLETQKPSLEQDRIYFELSSNYLGLYEQHLNNDYHGYLYTFNPSAETFNRSYYRDGEYTNVQAPSSSRTNSPEGNLVALVDKITSSLDIFFESNPNGAELFGFLTWFDIYRRLTINEVGALKMSNSIPILNKLESGMSRGYPIRPVLNEFNAFTTGIPDIEGAVPNDRIIVNLEDRISYYLGNT